MEEPSKNSLSGILKKSSFLVAGQAYFAIANFMVVVFLARLLPVEKFGLYAYSQSLFLMISIFGSLGLQTAVTQFTALHNGSGDYDKIKGILSGITKDAVVINVLLALCVVILCFTFGDSLFGQPGTALVLAILALTYPIRVISSLLIAFFQGLGLMQLVAFLQSVSEPTLRLLLLGTLYALSQTELIHWIIGLVIVSLLQAGLALYVFNQYVPTSILSSQSANIDRKKVYSFAIPFLVSSVALISVNNLDLILLGAMGELEEVGRYRIYKLLIMLVIAAISSVALSYHPTIAGLVGQDRFDEHGDGYSGVGRWMAYVGALGFLIMVFFAPLFVQVAFGPDYSASSSYIVLVLGIAVLVNVAFGPHWVSLIAIGRTRLMAVISAATVLSMTLSGLVAIPLFGLLGAAIAYAISQIVVNALGYLAYIKISDRKMIDKQVYYSVGASFLLGIVGFSIISQGLSGFTYTASSISMLFALLVVFCVIGVCKIMTITDRAIFVGACKKTFRVFGGKEGAL